MSKKERRAMGTAGLKHVEKNYNFDKLQESWVALMDNTHKKYGSWDTRKGYKNWELKEII